MYWVVPLMIWRSGGISKKHEAERENIYVPKQIPLHFF